MLGKTGINKILELTYDGIIVIDSECKVLFINRTARKLLNITQQYLGEPISRVIPYSRLPQVMETKISHINRYQALTENTVILYSNFPILNKRGEAVGGAAIIKDISDVGGLPDNAKPLKSLKEAHILIKAILDSTQDAVSVVDENGRGVFVNKAYAKLLGLSESEVLDKYNILDVEEHNSIHTKVLQSKLPIRNQQLKFQLREKEFIVHGTPIIVDHELKGSVVVSQDITEIKRISSAFDKVLDSARKLEQRYTFADIIGRDARLLEQISEARKILNTPATVLVLGERGTETEKFARALHNESTRKYKNFIKFNCGSIPPERMEEILFGSENIISHSVKKGLTKGLMEHAEGGTLYFDNITQLNPEMQLKILQLLRDKQYFKLGSDSPTSYNIRVIASSDMTVEKMVKEESFNKELYDRLGIFTINIPPLRERSGDIRLLTESIIESLNKKHGRNVSDISREAILSLIENPWKDNIAELENTLERAMLNMANDEKIMQVKHLPSITGRNNNGNIGVSQRHQIDENKSDTLEEYISQCEKEYIISVLCKHDGNRTKVAKELNISLRTLYYKMGKYEITGL